MSPKQLYFTILGFIITIIIIVVGVFFINQKQSDFSAVDTLTYLYNETGKEMMSSARASEIDQFKTWLNGNEDLLNKINNSGQEYLYCPDVAGTSFFMSWVKDSSKLRTGSTECYSTRRGKMLVTLECAKALVCIKSK